MSQPDPVAEHRAALVTEVEEAASPILVAAAAHTLQTVFGSHLAKENDLVVPLLVAADEVSLAGLLDGMHAIVGAGPGSATAGD